MRLFSHKKLLNLGGSKSFRGAGVLESATCPAHIGTNNKSLKVSISGGVPFFRCYLCGGPALGPITFVAKYRKVSLDEAAESIIQHSAFFGTDSEVTYYLDHEKMVYSAMSMFWSGVPTYVDSVKAARILTSVLSETESLFWNRSIVAMKDYRKAVPPGLPRSLSRIPSEESIFLRLLISPSGGPGAILVENEEGRELHRTVLDFQSRENCLYLSIPQGSMNRPWDRNTLMFQDSSVAASLWDWASPWGLSNTDSAIMSIAEVVGSPIRTDTFGNATMIASEDDIPLVGDLFRGSSNDIRVLCLPNEAKQAPSPFVLDSSTRSQRIDLRSPVNEMISRVLRWADRPDKQVSMTAFERMIESPFIPDAEKIRATETVVANLQEGQDDELLAFIENTYWSGSSVTESGTYIPTREGYLLRGSKSGSDLIVSNFIARVVGHLRFRGASSTILKVIPRGSADGFFASMGNIVTRNCSQILAAINRANPNSRSEILFLTSRRGRSISDIILGGSSSAASIDLPHGLGIGMSGSSFVFAEESFWPGGSEKRVSSSAGLLDWINRSAGIKGDAIDLESTHRRYLSQAESIGEDTQLSDNPLLPVLITGWFLRKCLLSPAGFRVSCPDTALRDAIATVSGMPCVTFLAFSRRDKEMVASDRVPVVLTGVAWSDAIREFKFFVTSNISIGSQPDGEIPWSIDSGVTQELEAHGLRNLIQSAVNSRCNEETAKSILGPAWEIDHVRELAKQVFQALDLLCIGVSGRFLDFLRSAEGKIFLEPRDRHSCLLNLDSVEAAFPDVHSRPSLRRLLPEMRKVGAVTGKARVRGGSSRETRWVVPVSAVESSIIEVDFRALNR